MKFTITIPVSLALLASLTSARPLAADPKPINTEPDEASNCIDWIVAQAGEDCSDLASRANLDLSTFLSWNPALSRNCFGAQAGWGYCDAIGGPPATTISTSTTSLAASTKSLSTTFAPSSVSTLVPSPSPTFFHYDTSQFPPSAGTLQCIKASSNNPNPVAVGDGPYLKSSIGTACQQIVESSKFLAVGDAYTTTIVSDIWGDISQFALQIKLGGFSVTHDYCVQALTQVMGCQTGGPSKTLGGCSYSSDLNFQACIFPTGQKGAPPPPLPPSSSTTTASPAATSSSAPTHPDPTQFPPANGEVQCVSAGTPNSANNIIDEGAIPWACGLMVGSGKFLEKGNPYVEQAKDNNDVFTFELTIKLGGFNVTQQICTDTMNKLLTCQQKNAQPPVFRGGCAYTDDFNLQACIFP